MNSHLALPSALILAVAASASIAAIALDDHTHASPPAPKTTQIRPAPATHAPESKVAPKPIIARPAEKPADKPPSNSRPAEQNAENEQAEHRSAPAKPETTKPETTKPDSGREPASESAAATTADAALRLLVDGNARWVAGSPQNPSIDLARREALAKNGQTPFATVLTCADSRLPVERLFDRGVGEIFVTRVAGNVVSPHEAGSIEYAAEHLHTPLLVVMGHTKCGAVKAAISGKSLTPNIDSLVNDIKPAVERAKAQNPGDNDESLLTAAIKENVWESIFDLIKSSEPLRTMVKENKIRIVGAVCDISTGKVSFLGEHPWQSPLIEALDTSAPATNRAATAHDGAK